MKIKTIEYENFRNFKERGIIKFSTDGKFTIIYGLNGEGKTTLHQLFQWIFYGKVHFNKTSSPILYNLAFEAEQKYGATFEVFGRADFEHDGEEYSLTRKRLYKKGIDDSEKISEEVVLHKMDSDYNWKKVEKPMEVVEKLLPSGLSEYFFFDGERMIADLKYKSDESADKLKSTLFSLFDLDVVESAVNHLGRTDLKTTVLGKLYLSKGTITSDSTINKIKTNIENAQNKISDFDEKIKADTEEKENKQELIQSISEQIGGSKSKAEYEHQRKELQSQRDQFIENAKSDQIQFGETIMDMFPKLLISKAVVDAQKKIHLKVNDSSLPQGINKRLIAYLTKLSTTECICGRELCEEHRKHINDYLNQMPPKSYTSLYYDFKTRISQWGKDYDKDKIEGIIKRNYTNQDQAQKCDEKIRLLDIEEKKSKDIELLINDRQAAEARIIELDRSIKKMEVEREKYRLYLKKQMAEFDKYTKDNKNGEEVQYKIDIINDVLDYFTQKLDVAAKEYSQELESNIKELLRVMFTTKREVSVSSDFSVRVYDSYNDESKSEGQFAVVSFAYIGGILKILRESKELMNKEYPLVLDGPFSKLDPEQRQNVVNTLPDFAPQVILFSKEDLHDVVKPEYIGRVWTLQSNDERNIATVEEGKLWN